MLSFLLVFYFLMYFSDILSHDILFSYVFQCYPFPWYFIFLCILMLSFLMAFCFLMCINVTLSLFPGKFDEPLFLSRAGDGGECFAGTEQYEKWRLFTVFFTAQQ